MHTDTKLHAHTDTYTLISSPTLDHHELLIRVERPLLQAFILCVVRLHARLGLFGCLGDYLSMRLYINNHQKKLNLYLKSPKNENFLHFDQKHKPLTNIKKKHHYFALHIIIVLNIFHYSIQPRFIIIKSKFGTNQTIPHASSNKHATHHQTNTSLSPKLIDQTLSKATHHTPTIQLTPMFQQIKTPTHFPNPSHHRPAHRTNTQPIAPPPNPSHHHPTHRTTAQPIAPPNLDSHGDESPFSGLTMQLIVLDFGVVTNHTRLFIMSLFSLYLLLLLIQTQVSSGPILLPPEPS